MENENEKMDLMKKLAKEYIDKIDTKTKIGRKAIKMIYGFAEGCYENAK